MRCLPHLTRLNGRQVAVPFIFCDEIYADEQTHLCRLTLGYFCCHTVADWRVRRVLEPAYV